MRRSINKLTAIQVKSLKAKEKTYRVSDGGNLYLLVKPSGAKSWQFRYKNRSTGTLTYTGLGGYPATALVKARSKAQEYREIIADGGDLKEHLVFMKNDKISRTERTFSSVAIRFLELELTKNSASTYKLKEARLRNYLIPVFGHVDVEELKPDLVLKALDPVKERKQLSLVHKLIELINQVMRLGIALGYIKYNQLVHLHELYARPEKKHLPALHWHQTGNFMRRMATVHMEFTTRALMEFQFHTLVRASEAASARWEDVDIENLVWTIPGGNMKMKKSFKVPLSDYCLVILKSMKVFRDDSGYIFVSSRNKKGHVDSETVNKAIVKAGYLGQMTAHGMRSMGSTACNDKGFQRDIIEMCLSHQVKGTVEQAYNRSDYFEKRAEIMNWWSSYLASQTPVELRIENYA
jgi:integrase